MIERDNKLDPEYNTRITRGNITAYVFDQSFLPLNIPQDSHVMLSERVYVDDIPVLNLSTLEVLDDEGTTHLHGFIQFDVPPMLRRGNESAAVLLKQLLLHLTGLFENESTVITFHGKSLEILSPLQESISLIVSIDNDGSAYIELNSELPASSNETSQYNQIIMMCELWAELQRYLMQSSRLSIPQQTIYVGKTGSHKLSDIELAIEQYLGMYNTGEALIAWSNDVNGHDLGILERNLTDQTSTQAIAHEVVRQNKLSEENRSITQGDIVKAISKVLAERRKAQRNGA